MAQAAQAKTTDPCTVRRVPGQRVRPNRIPAMAAAASATMKEASPGAARSTGKRSVSKVAESTIHVAPFRTTFPPTGGVSPGRIMYPNARPMNAAKRADFARSASAPAAVADRGIRTKSARGLSSAYIPAGTTSASRCSIFRSSSFRNGRSGKGMAQGGGAAAGRQAAGSRTSVRMQGQGFRSAMLRGSQTSGLACKRPRQDTGIILFGAPLDPVRPDRPQ